MSEGNGDGGRKRRRPGRNVREGVREESLQKERGPGRIESWWEGVVYVGEIEGRERDRGWKGGWEGGWEIE